MDSGHKSMTLKQLDRRMWYTAIWVLVVAGAAALLGAPQDKGAARAADEAQPAPLAKLITLTSPVDDALYSRVRNTLLVLKNQAALEERRPVLVLQVTPGSSQMHQVQGLMRLLTEAQFRDVTTVAWVPETVTGNNAILALACQEIVMHPDAMLGDIGHGRTVEPVDRDFVLGQVEKRHNRMLSAALVRGMMDPQQAVLKVKVRTGTGDDATIETRIVTPDEHRRLIDSRVDIPEVVTIKEKGDLGKYSGKQARDLDILAVSTALSLGELADGYRIPRESLRELATDDRPVKARLIAVEGEIIPVQASFIERQIDRAQSDDVNLIIFKIDSPGGLLQSAHQLSTTIAYLDEKKIRTVAFIPEKGLGAISAAGIVALACDEIYMEPLARIGDAGPIILGPDGVFERAPEKTVSFVREMLSSLAKRKGRPPALLMAMADMKLKVFKVVNRDNGRVWYMSREEIDRSGGEWIEKEPVAGTGGDTLLTVNGDDAHALLLAAPPVKDFDELKTILGIPANQAVLEAQRNWVDDLIFWLNSRMALGLLVTAGVICIFLELHFMNGLMGIIAAVCFGLVFWSRFMGGTAGWLEVILFLLGIGCIAIEIFVVPGFTVFGVAGGLLVLASLVLASQTFAGPSVSEDFGQTFETMKYLSGSILAIVVVAVVLNNFLPRIPFMNRMILTPPGYAPAAESEEPRLRPDLVAPSSSVYGYADVEGLLGQSGHAESSLRPAGKARIGGRFVNVVSEGQYIPQGRSVTVVAVEGNRIVVRET